MGEIGRNIRGDGGYGMRRHGGNAEEIWERHGGDIVETLRSKVM